MNAPGYTVECARFTPYEGSVNLGSASFVVTPPGLQLQHVLLVTTPCGLRVVFPRRDDPQRRRFAKFPDSAAWATFSELAVAAIEAAYPGQIPPRRFDTLSPRNVHTPTTHNEMSYANAD
jgi:hypothetical protein